MRSTQSYTMTATKSRAYLSPSLVLLALDWADGEQRDDFLGFAIKRTPGFLDFKTNERATSSWLPNRLDFNGPQEAGQPDFPTDQAPVQKFMWWDARLEGLTPADAIQYDVFAVTGKPANLQLEPGTQSSITVHLPMHVEFGIGTWFNRAVMSSQAFSRMVNAMNLQGALPSDDQALTLRQWLANAMETPVPNLIANAKSIVGAIYHLTDVLWIVPAFDGVMSKANVALVYDSHRTKDAKTGQLLPGPNDDAIKTLSKVTFHPRDKTNIMHNKFLVDGVALSTASATPERLTCGSANYTTEGLTSQANLVHTFESPELARLYFDRFELIKGNPSLQASGAANTGWSKTVSVGDAGIRAFYSPEKAADTSVAMETIVQAVHEARSSVVFCLFTPTDQDLRDACFSIGDAGKMMFGIVNHIAHSEPSAEPNAGGKIPADKLAALEIYHRSRTKKDVIGAEFFDAKALPAGFDLEVNVFPGEHPPPYPPVIIHHKFIVIDAETDNPTIYTGSANMSGNSVYKNDENLLEIKGSPRLARLYLAEFMRLYEHYRARAQFIAFKQSGHAPAAAGFALTPDRRWAKAHYTPGTLQFRSRTRLLSID